MNAVKFKLHPRIGFMILVPGAVLVVLASLVLLSPHPGKSGVLQVIAAAAAVNYAAVAAALWEQMGRSIRWDEKAVYLGQISRFGIIGKGHVKLPYDVTERVELAGMPRGVPPRFPLVAIASTTSRFLIDPNYYNTRSLLGFLGQLSERAPQIDSSNQGTPFHRVIRRLERMS